MAFLFGIIQVILALKNNTLNFYAGIISVLLYTILFYNYKLYAESILNVYYFIASILGIFLWQQKQQATISITTKQEKAIAFLVFLFSFIILYFILKKCTDSNVPILDAFVTSTAWAGTWLLLKRKIENWLALTVSNLVAIPLQIYKGLELTALLTIIYLAIAILGYNEWKKILKETEQKRPA